jgi:hypothetical protein
MIASKCCATAATTFEPTSPTGSADRMAQIGLRLHPTKTRIVHCRDGDRRDSYEHTSFTFLGFTFRARGAQQDRREVHLVPARD